MAHSIPSELLMGRKLRNSLPTFHTNVNPSWPDIEKLREREEESKEKQRINFNQRHNAVHRKPLLPGTPVHIKHLEVPGTVLGAAQTTRSYLIETEKRTVRRNLSHLNPTPRDTSEPPRLPQQQPQNKVLTPIKPLPSPCISSRPKRLIRPSLRLRESLRLEGTFCLSEQLSEHFDSSFGQLILSRI